MVVQCSALWQEWKAGGGARVLNPVQNAQTENTTRHSLAYMYAYEMCACVKFLRAQAASWL